MKYVNRKGKVYYVFQGQTKTGKPKYYTSIQAESNSGVPIDSLPSEYELFESPIDARVVVRKKLHSDITENELQFVREQIELLVRDVKATLICQDQYIVIYASARPQESQSMPNDFGELASKMMELMQTTAHMSPAFRFKLISKEERVFEAERFCYRGAVDDWMSLNFDGQLDELCQIFLGHVGQESFYELI